MSNSILTISMITREALRVLENNLTFTKGVNRSYDDQFAVKGAKIGSTVNIRKPARYVGRSGPTLAIEDQTEKYVPLTLNTQFGVDVQFTSADLLLSMDDFSKRFIKPAMATVANKIDSDGLAQYLNVANSVGTPATAITTLDTYLQGNALYAENGAPIDDLRSMVIGPRAEAKIVNGLTTLFNPVKEISRQYDEGKMGRAIGLKWSMDQNVPFQTVGPYSTSAPLVAGANQTGSSLITDTWAASAAAILNVGDVFTIAGVHTVNPQSRKSTGQLQNFVLTAPMVNDGSGNSTLSIYPSIITSGQFQTVDASPADDAALTIYGSANAVAAVNMLYHRDAFVLGTADLELPGGVDMASKIADPESGLAIRMVRAYDIRNDVYPCRLDVLYGWATLYPELAVRVHS